MIINIILWTFDILDPCSLSIICISILINRYLTLKWILWSLKGASSLSLNRQFSMELPNFDKSKVGSLTDSLCWTTGVFCYLCSWWFVHHCCQGFNSCYGKGVESPLKHLQSNQTQSLDMGNHLINQWTEYVVTLQISSYSKWML